MESAWYFKRSDDPIAIIKRAAVRGATIPWDWCCLAQGFYVGTCAKRYLKRHNPNYFWVGPVKSTQYVHNKGFKCDGCGHRHGVHSPGKTKVKIRGNLR
jgi:hypothetical protein